MAGSQISGTVKHTVRLDHGVYQTPLYITGSGDVAPTHRGADGIYGSARVQSAVIYNGGQVKAASGHGVVNGGIGIDMHAAIMLTNDGTIAGGGAGQASGYNDCQGGNGVDLSAGGTITNMDLIGGGGGSSSYSYAGGQGGTGVDLFAGGTIDNGGSITGG